MIKNFFKRKATAAKRKELEDERIILEEQLKIESLKKRGQ